MKKIIAILLMVLLFPIVLSTLIIEKQDKHLNFTKQNQIKFDEAVKKSNPKIQSNENFDITVYIAEKDIIQKIDLETYTACTVASEMPAEFEMEALKAQAVAARTYALAHTEIFGGKKCVKSKGANLCNTVHCQVFKPREELIKKWSKNKSNFYWNKIINAVYDTQNEVLSYNNQLVLEPCYFSTSSGKTEDAVDVFFNSKPYLKSVKSPGEQRSPKYKTNFDFDYSELTRILNNSCKEANLTPNSLKDQLVVLERSNAGSVKKIRVGTNIINGSVFRNILNLNSTNFTINFYDSKTTITCSGYGHGVGMSQWGADAMAKQGYDYKQILKHYYTGIEIFNYKNLLKE